MRVDALTNSSLSPTDELLFRTMKEKEIPSYKFAKLDFPIFNYHKIHRGKNTSTHAIDAFCVILDCDVPGIMEFP